MYQNGDYRPMQELYATKEKRNLNTRNIPFNETINNIQNLTSKITTTTSEDILQFKLSTNEALNLQRINGKK